MWGWGGSAAGRPVFSGTEFQFEKVKGSGRGHGPWLYNDVNTLNATEPYT